ncbi:hypothetical protein N8955_00040 [bacterium]|jgi:hypothetical protein|nr:hypothetical protein [Hellea sp.]MDA7807104.1 hypothetical protein [bacterium]MDA9047737.1 hypothetical protein [Hellea sp.]MDA9225377.1 hypothetical protein [bacterium]
MSDSNDIDADIEVMVEQIKNPNDWPAWGKKYIYESPDGGSTVYAREFGKPSAERVLIKGEEQ